MHDPCHAATVIGEWLGYPISVCTHVMCFGGPAVICRVHDGHLSYYVDTISLTNQKSMSLPVHMSNAVSHHLQRECITRVRHDQT